MSYADAKITPKGAAVPGGDGAAVPGDGGAALLALGTRAHG